MANIFKRSLSLSATVNNMVKTPIQVYGVEGRYASALYSAAVKSKTLENVDKDLQKVKQLYETDAKFKEFAINPTLQNDKKKEAVKKIAKALGVSKEATNFFGVLAENGRLNILEAVINSFESIMRAHKGELFVEVTSAAPLSKAHQSSLSDALGKFNKGGKNLTVKYIVKPEIVGGLIVNLGDKYVDMSMATRIKKYHDALNEAL
ncbi:ATP synthase subunit O, mitochondrial [Strongyloides ratti]|uniref:ATP synthase peripheral stalk subunit OSCP, mitochondrial n=1 Tax=Strongyloides ratti TaxID=34506 RepID=A0A090LD28_STRRB|nr:ATP synthase subunit O, mitochondrial [Strongyloides ratti]CEF66038.1 ATP synthase subunit O, mitochondrial [Strongyloides ratti]